MTSVTSPGESSGRAVLEAAEAQYRRTIEALNEIITEVAAGRSARAKELRGALGDLGRAAQTAFDERAKVERRLEADSAGAGAYALDLDAARDEIGRRLARLRAAGDAEGVSGEPE